MTDEGKKVKVKKRRAVAQAAAGGPPAAEGGRAPGAGPGQQATLDGEPEAGGKAPAPSQEEGPHEISAPRPTPDGDGAPTDDQLPVPAAGEEDDGVPLLEELEPESGEAVAAEPAPKPAAPPGGTPPQTPEDDVQRLRRELSERLFELELEKDRMEELGTELAATSEELERRESELKERSGKLEKHETEQAGKAGQLKRREDELAEKAGQIKGREAELSVQAAALKKMEAELGKRHELVSTSTEAMNALGEELRQREHKVKRAEEETARQRQEFEALRKELDNRAEKIAKERAESEQEMSNVEKLVSDIQTREGVLRRSEVDHGKKLEELERARKEAEALDGRLKAQADKLARRAEEVQALEQHLSSIEEEIRLCPHCGAVEEFSHLAQRSEELREKGEDAEELNVEIRQARKALRAGDYENATAHSRRAAELLRHGELERARREVTARIVSAESLVRMLKEVRADVSGMEAALAEAWSHFKGERMDKALEAAERARQQGMAVERERFTALDELVASNSVIAALKKSGVNIHGAEQKRAEAEKAMAAGDFKTARTLAAETVVLASEAAQSQDVATAMSQIKLAEETLDELRALGLDVTEWERMVNRSRDFLKKLDFKSAEETARWARQKGRDAGRQYRQALMALDHSGSVLSTYKDMGLLVRKAEDLQDEAKAKLKDGDPDMAQNLARKAEKMVREIAERHKGAQAALKKAIATIRNERKAGKDVARGEKLYDLAQHQLELGEYANAMKLATKAAEAVTSASVALLELCPTCGEAIPENIPECPSCAEKKKVRKEAAEKGAELAQRSKLGSKGGRKYACPYCSELFEIAVPARPITISCPWCGYEVSVVD